MILVLIRAEMYEGWLVARRLKPWAHKRKKLCICPTNACLFSVQFNSLISITWPFICQNSNRLALVGIHGVVMLADALLMHHCLSLTIHGTVLLIKINRDSGC